MKQRSQQKELLDLGPEYYSSDEYEDCLNKLFRVNYLLGIFHSTRRLIRRLLPIQSLVDVGCGNGLFLLHLHAYFPSVSMIGLDVSADAITAAQKQLTQWNTNTSAPLVDFHLQKNPEFSYSKNSVDVVLATLVCHHLTDDELVDFFQRALLAANKAVILNDLYRHKIAECFFALLSPLFVRNRLIKHDGIISIRRGFTRRDWQNLLAKAGIKKYQILLKFPFRWQVILWKTSDSHMD